MSGALKKLGHCGGHGVRVVSEDGGQQQYSRLAGRLITDCPAGDANAWPFFLLRRFVLAPRSSAANRCLLVAK